MEEKQLLAIAEIDEKDWEQTPVSVRNLVVKLVEKIEQLEKHLKELQESNEKISEKINQNSQNSNNPPTSDPLNVEIAKKKKKLSSKKRGGQVGHKGHSRFLYAVEDCKEVIEHYPENCKYCSEKLTGIDPTPYRHQIVEIPPIVLEIVEHRLHQRNCEKCGKETRAVLPLEVETSGYGERVVALVSLMSGMYRHSHRMVVSAMWDYFGLKIGLGTINRLRNQGSEAVSMAVEEAKVYVQSQAIVGADETGFKQGNSDGKNPEGKKAWLWVAVTPLVTMFQVMLARSTEAAQSLLGEKFGGILNSDRYNAYNWLDVCQRQLCWAHLKREFTRMSERKGVSRQLGRDLLAQQKRLFRLWAKVRDGTLSFENFQTSVLPIRKRLKELLEEGAAYEITPKEKTPLAHTVRTCRQLLKVEPALWLFVAVKGLEPTNNAAERAIRPAVLWRKNSFGSQSEEGSIFVARMLTVVTTLRSQNRNVLDFLTDAIRANRKGTTSPSLLPL
jgi:hypothetical protein